MITSKLHNPIIARNSHISNAVVEKVNNAEEQLFSDLENATPIIPETGRVWYNSENGGFKFSNILSNGEHFIDEFVSRTDTRTQKIKSKIHHQNTLIVENIDNPQLTVDIIDKSFVVSDTQTADFNTSSFNIKHNNITRFEINHVTDEFNLTYKNTSITGDMSVDGNMIVTGDLTVGGQTTKVDIAAENMTIADNVIVLNSNLTTEDPRLASAIVDGEDVDNNAGIAINRGSEGILDLIKWIESTDTSDTTTLKDGTAHVSIWNYEAAEPSYELHQIIDAYTIARTKKDLSGTGIIGYDGETGIHYTNAINNGDDINKISKYTFKLPPAPLSDSIDTIVQKIDDIVYNNYNKIKVGETSTKGKIFTITHNLGTVFVDIKIQREEDNRWFYDILPIEIIDNNTIRIESSEEIKIRYMISAIHGFDIDPENDIIIE